MHNQILPLLNTQDVAAIFRVSPKTIRVWCSQGKLRSRRIGRGLRFTHSEVERLAGETRLSYCALSSSGVH